MALREQCRYGTVVHVRDQMWRAGWLVDAPVVKGPTPGLIPPAQANPILRLLRSCRGKHGDRCRLSSRPNSRAPATIRSIYPSVSGAPGRGAAGAAVGGGRDPVERGA